MSSKNWMDENTLGDVQSALQSQTIQTALEQNTSKITDAGFQSYLTSAPIPRCWTTDCTPNTALASVATVMIWPTTALVDPYGMVDLTTGFITCPIDGLYHAYFGYSGTASFSLRSVRYYWQAMGGSAWGIMVVSNVYSTNVYQGSSNALIPCRAGQLLKATVLDDTASDVASPTANMAVSWIAPYNLYTGGNA